MITTIDSLTDLGVEIEAERKALPFRLIGKGSIPGGRLEIDASASSQFVSGLLLSAPRYESGLDLHHVGNKLPSLPHIEMTIACLRAFRFNLAAGFSRYRADDFRPRLTRNRI